MKKEKDIIKIDLSRVDGTVAYTVAEYNKQIDSICLSDTLDLSKKKEEVIDLLKSNTKETPYMRKVIYKIRSIKDSMSLLTYMYNVTLAGAGMYSY